EQRVDRRGKDGSVGPLPAEGEDSRLAILRKRVRHLDRIGNSGKSNIACSVGVEEARRPFLAADRFGKQMATSPGRVAGFAQLGLNGGVQSIELREIDLVVAGCPAAVARVRHQESVGEPWGE